MIIKKTTTTGRLRITGYAILLANGEYGPLCKSWAEAIKMALTVGL